RPITSEPRVPRLVSTLRPVTRGYIPAPLRDFQSWHSANSLSHSSPDRRQLESLALLARAPGVGLLIAGELPLLRVPLEALAVPVGEIDQVTRRHAARADFDIADRLGPALDAVEPVG